MIETIEYLILKYILLIFPLIQVVYHVEDVKLMSDKEYSIYQF